MVAGDEIRCPPLWSQSRARRSADPRARLMAHSLDALTVDLPAAVAVISPVDRRLNAFTTAPIVGRLDPPDFPLDVEAAHLAYLRGYHTEDPFAPRRWADRNVTVLGVGDVGGADAVARSPFGRGFLATHGLAIQAAVYLRDRGRLVAFAVLARRIGDRVATSGEIERLRRIQPFLEEALAIAWGRSPTPAPAMGLSTLTEREREVSRLVGAGASNAEIASALCISVNTVKTHMQRILAKLELRSRTELALLLSAAPRAPG